MQREDNTENGIDPKRRGMSLNFNLSEDEELLKALAERFIADHYDYDRRRAYIAEPCGFSAQNWALLGELGLLAAPFSAEDGGMDLDATAIATIFEALGRGLAVEPIIENILVGGRLLAATAPESLRDAWLPGLLDGSRRIALAHHEQGARGGSAWVECTARPDGSRILLNGTKTCVPAGAGVDAYIVSASTASEPDDRDAIGLYLVPADSSGLSCQHWRMTDGSVAVSLAFDNVVVENDNVLRGGIQAIEAGEVLASLARSAEMLGIMERMLAETQEYLRTRNQFGTSLGKFQAIQHRMVTQYTVIEQGRALLNLAQVSWGKPEFARAVAGVRAYLALNAIELGHEMIQFHGGMGVTDELSVGGAHKRLLLLSRWPVDPDTALDCFAEIAA